MAKQYKGKAMSKASQPSFIYCAYRTIKGLITLALVAFMTVSVAISMLFFCQIFKVWL